MLTRVPLRAQQEGLQFARGRDYVGFLMSMRVGKTICAIRQSKRWRPKSVLIVAPATNVLEWIADLELEGIKATAIHGPVKRGWEEAVKQPGWFVVNYERLRVSPWLYEIAWDVVVLDESTFIRNPRSAISQVCNNFLIQAPHRIICSGVINPEDHLDVYQQMRWLCGGTFMGCTDWYQFRHRFFHPDFMGWRWTPNYKTVDKIKAEIRQHCFIKTAKQAGIHAEGTRITCKLRLPPALRKVYRDVERKWLLSGKRTKWVVEQLGWLSRLTGGAMKGYESDYKVNKVLKLALKRFPTDQMVLWFRYNSELRRCLRALRSEEVSCTAITGLIPPRERRRRRLLFQNGKRRLILMQTKCARFGLDCSAADIAVYYSMYYDGEYSVQSAARIVHPKKNRKLLYLYLVASNTVDEDVVGIVNNKLKNQRHMVSRVRLSAMQRWKARSR